MASLSAFTPTAVARTVRKVVSKDRNRFQDYEYDLDLSYITNNIIAMGFPSSGIERLWRNSIDEVCDMLNKYHGDKFKIWNLSGRTYNHERLDKKIEDFGFPDHHSPPLEMLFKIVFSITDFVTANPDHVAVVHCMGGKGRTGTVVACCLMYSNLFKDTLDALNHFAQKRSSISKGVIQASQIRYTKYFGDIINKRMKLDLRKSIRITRIQMSQIPNWSKNKAGSVPVIEIYSVHHYPKKLLWSSIKTLKPYLAGTGPVVWDLSEDLESDILIVFGKYQESKKAVVKKFRFSFHCAFVSEGELQLKAEEFDIHGDKKNLKKWFDPNWHVQIKFTKAANSLIEDNDHDHEVKHYLEKLNQELKAMQLQNVNKYNGTVTPPSTPPTPRSHSSTQFVPTSQRSTPLSRSISGNARRSGSIIGGFRRSASSDGCSVENSPTTVDSPLTSTSLPASPYGPLQDPVSPSGSSSDYDELQRKFSVESVGSNGSDAEPEPEDESMISFQEGPRPSVDILDDRPSETLYDMLERMELERKKWLQHTSTSPNGPPSPDEPSHGLSSSKGIHRSASKSRFRTSFWRSDSQGEKESQTEVEVEQEISEPAEARIVIGQFGMM